jgi:molybdopterin/thiamine biosynthesis adenylyltransferase
MKINPPQVRKGARRRSDAGEGVLVTLSEAEASRYARQMLIPEWGEGTQDKLRDRTVFVAGAGGLGSPVSIYLAAAGVGHLRIADFDTVDQTNLNRQILHDETRIGVNKADSARMTLERVNPHIRITALPIRIDPFNVDELVDDADIIMDCMDNFATRYLLNDSAIRKGIPLVFGSIWGLHGQISFFHVPETACLRCLVRDEPPLEIFPVLGAIPAVIGSWQTLEALKYLTGVGRNLKGQLLVWDGDDMEVNTYSIRPDPQCRACAWLRQ